MSPRLSRVLFAALLLALASLLFPPQVALATIPVGFSQEDPVSTLEDVELAVIQIEAVGSFVDPEEGVQTNVPGRGSGFIIDPSGIAVTNNHVVTGGALFRVFVSGRARPVNARVLGVSECSDLAVIDLQGEDYPYLGWADREPNVATPVYSAGFPLGDPEYALTSGIISKDNANGESSWSSLDYVFMHDADINPGNSGGPLVNGDGEVVGVNYASVEAVDQNFAIPLDEARDIVDVLMTEQNVNSLGINGEAFDDGEVSGIFVYSVESGSPADLVGIEAGDIVAEIEGLPMGLNSEMVEYCDILASHSATDVLSVVVYRAETDEILEGQFNGRPLESAFDIGEETVITGGAESATPGTSGDGYTYESVSDSAGIVHLELPTEWDDRSERVWESTDGDLWGNQYLASTDLDSFFDDWSIPGVIFSFSDTLQEETDPDGLLDSLDYSDTCDYQGREEWPGDSFYSGAYDEYLDCAGGGITTWVVALQPESADYMIQIEVYASTDEDLAALDHILDTFYVEAGTAPVAIAENLGEDIFEIIDVEGLDHDYTFLQEPYFAAVVPAIWQEVESQDWLHSETEELLGKFTLVSADIERYRGYWSEPGFQAYLVTNVDEDYNPDDSQDDVDFSDECTLEEREEHEHTIYGLTYTGVYDVYSDCAGSGNLLYSGSFVESSFDHAILIDFVSLDEADDEAWDVLLQSFFLPSGVQAQVSTEGFITVSDDTGRITLSVPDNWQDSYSGEWELDDGDVVGIEATFAEDVEDFDNSWEEPGIYVNVWDEWDGGDPDDILDEIDMSDDCTYDTRFDYEGDLFVGRYDLYTDCGDVEGSLTAVMALFPVDSDEMLVLLELTMPTDTDRVALDPVLNTLQVLPAE